MSLLEGQVALVTGGGSGIGRAVVARFIEEGARIVVLDRVPERATQLQAEFGNRVVPLTGDVAHPGDDKRAVAETVGAFGRLDIFVGNAGVFDVYAQLAEFPEEKLSQAFDELFAVNVKGCFFGAKAALPELMKTEGSMVFTASVAGLNSGGGGTLYAASKHAVVIQEPDMTYHALDFRLVALWSKRAPRRLVGRFLDLEEKLPSQIHVAPHCLPPCALVRNYRSA